MSRPKLMASRKPRAKRTGKLSPAIRAILARTAAGRAALDVRTAGADMRELDLLPVSVLGAITRRKRGLKTKIQA